MEISKGKADEIGVMVDLAICMSIWNFARTNPEDFEIEGFFEACEQRLVEQELNAVIIKKTINQFKKAINDMKGLYGKNKH